MTDQFLLPREEKYSPLERIHIENRIFDFLKDDLGIDLNRIRMFKLSYNPVYHFWDVYFYKDNIITNTSTATQRKTRWQDYCSRIKDAPFMNVDTDSWMWEYDEIPKDELPTPGIRFWIGTEQPKVDLPEASETWSKKDYPEDVVTIILIADRPLDGSSDVSNGTVVYDHPIFGARSKELSLFLSSYQRIS